MTNKMEYTTNYLKMSRVELLERVQMQMGERRFKHVLGVEEMAIALAGRYEADIEAASIAALTLTTQKSEIAMKCKS